MLEGFKFQTIDAATRNDREWKSTFMRGTSLNRRGRWQSVWRNINVGVKELTDMVSLRFGRTKGFI